MKVVSVPLWGLFNLTDSLSNLVRGVGESAVSVPLWGLFNLTELKFTIKGIKFVPSFRPLMGII